MATPSLDPAMYTLVERAISQTLEGMAFTAVYPIDTLDEPDDPDSYGRIQVLSPGKGWLSLEMTAALARQLTEAMYGFLEEELPDTVRDALKELANTFAGRFCAVVCGENEAFEVGLPKALVVGQDEEPFTADDWPHADFAVEDHLLRIRIEPELLEIANEKRKSIE